MARETFLSRIDVTNAIPSGRQYGIDSGWTGYRSPACLFNKKGSGKRIRIRKVSISPVAVTDVGNTTGAILGISSITEHSVVDANYTVTKLDSTSAAFPATIEIGTNVFSATTSQSLFRASSYNSNSPRATNVLALYQKNFYSKWNDATTVETQQQTLRNGEGLAVLGGNTLTTTTYTSPIRIVMLVRLSDTGAAYLINASARIYVPYMMTILNNGYTAGNVQVLSIELVQEKPYVDPETPAAIQDHAQEIVLIRNAEINSAGSEVTPQKMDSTNSLNANVVCLKGATVVPMGQLNSSWSRTITVGNSLMRNRNAWLEQRDAYSTVTNENVLFASLAEEEDLILNEGSGIAYIPSTYDGAYASYYIDFLFTQENTEVNAVYPAVGDVDLSVTYGPTGADYTGTLAQPSVTDVRTGVQYGAGGTEYTGTYAGGGGGNTFILNE